MFQEINQKTNIRQQYISNRQNPSKKKFFFISKIKKIQKSNKNTKIYYHLLPTKGYLVR
jgi:hypothetical protein